MKQKDSPYVIYYLSLCLLLHSINVSLSAVQSEQKTRGTCCCRDILTGEKNRNIKCLSGTRRCSVVLTLHQHEYLNSDPQNTCQKSARSGHSYDTSTGVDESRKASQSSQASQSHTICKVKIQRPCLY